MSSNHFTSMILIIAIIAEFIFLVASMCFREGCPPSSSPIIYSYDASEVPQPFVDGRLHFCQNLFEDCVLLRFSRRASTPPPLPLACLGNLITAAVMLSLLPFIRHWSSI